MNSCLYRGRIQHRRHRDPPHAFEYPVCLAYLDLDELDGVFAGSRLWSVGRATAVSFRRADHLGDPEIPLAESVRSLVASRLGFRPEGSIRLLTQPRYLGFGFNPASFHYCFEPGAGRLEAVVVEVTNTPWLERHTYVLDLRGQRRVDCEKTFHVSPFMGMDQRYVWSIQPPGDRLQLAVSSLEASRPVFEAHLSLRRVEITPRSLRRSFARFPVQTARLAVGIYTQALRLRLAGARFHSHPRHLARTSEEKAA